MPGSEVILRHRKRTVDGGRAPLRAPLTAARLTPFLLGALLAVMLGGHRAVAQQAVTSATLGGHVEDANGATLPGASVTATAVDTGRRLTSVSDGEGRYRFPYVPVGTYLLKAEKAGFAPLTVRLTATVGQALDLPLRLSPSGIAENVVVTAAEAPFVETTRTQVAETIVTGEIGSLPLNGRNYLDLAALAPGVSRTNPVANQRFPETSAVPGAGLSITGQRSINNGFVVDGLSSTDDAAGLAGTFYSQEVIREFEVVTSGGVAEFGRASGGFVNIVTRSGTNDFNGRAYGFLRNQRLDARAPLSPSKDPLTQAQYGASAGGPVRRGRTFFFSNLERTRLDNVVPVDHHARGGQGRQRAPRTARVRRPARLDRDGAGGLRLDKLPLPPRSTVGRVEPARGALQPLRRFEPQRAQRRRPERRQPRHGAREPRPDRRRESRDHSFRRGAQRGALPVHAQPPRRAGQRRGGAGGQHLRRRQLRHGDLLADGARPRHVRAAGQRDRAARLALAQGGREPPVRTRRYNFPRRVAGRLHLHLARELRRGPLRDLSAGVRRGRAVSVESERRALRAGRVEAAPRPDRQPRAAVRRAVFARPHRDGREQLRAAHWCGLLARLSRARPPDGCARQLRRLLRPPAAARHLERLAARRVEVPRGRAPLRRRGRARLSHAARSLPRRLARQRHDHRPAHTLRVQPAGEPASRARTVGRDVALGRLPAHARASHRRLAQRQRAALPCLGGRAESGPTRCAFRQRLALRVFGRQLLRRNGRLLQAALRAEGARARLLHFLEGD